MSKKSDESNQIYRFTRFEINGDMAMKNSEKRKQNSCLNVRFKNLLKNQKGRKLARICISAIRESETGILFNM